MQNIIEINTDGGSRGNPGPAACAFSASLSGKILQEGSKFLGTATNNVAEYEGVILALEWLTKKYGADYDVLFFLDSELVVRQLNGIYKIKKPELQTLSLKIKGLINLYKGKIIFKNVPREDNKRPDALLNRELDLH